MKPAKMLSLRGSKSTKKNGGSRLPPLVNSRHKALIVRFADRRPAGRLVGLRHPVGRRPASRALSLYHDRPVRRRLPVRAPQVRLVHSAYVLLPYYLSFVYYGLRPSRQDLPSLLPVVSRAFWT